MSSRVVDVSVQLCTNEKMAWYGQITGHCADQAKLRCQGLGPVLCRLHRAVRNGDGFLNGSGVCVRRHVGENRAAQGAERRPTVVTDAGQINPGSLAFAERRNWPITNDLVNVLASAAATREFCAMGAVEVARSLLQ